MRTQDLIFFHPLQVISSNNSLFWSHFYPTFFLLSCSCNSMSALWLIALFFIPEFTIQYLLSIYLMGCEKGLFCWIFWCVPHKCNIFFSNIITWFSAESYTYIINTNVNAKTRFCFVYNNIKCKLQTQGSRDLIIEYKWLRSI